jgi:hypothetical protein
VPSGKDLEEIRETYKPEENRRACQVSTGKFAFSFAFSVVFLITIVIIAYGTGMTHAFSVAQVGGFQANIGSIEGADLQIYPGITESSACENTANDYTPVSGDSYLPAVSADIGSAKVPYGEPISLTKTIAVPNILRMDAVRIGFSKSYGSTADVNNSSYSRSIGSSSSDEHIEEVDLGFSGNGNLNNPTGDNGGYEDFTDINTYLNKSESTELTVTYNTGGFNHYVRAWVDWNQDGVFNDTLASNGGEAYNVGNSDTDTTDDTFVFVPESAKPGPTMMRVSQRRGGYPSPDASGDGETEDYTVIVDNPTILGDASLSISQLSADRIELNTIQADEEYTDGTDTNPSFGKSGGPYGGFVLKGQTAGVTGVSGNAHFVSFADLNIPGVQLELDYLDPSYTDDVDATQYTDASIYGANPGEDIVAVEWGGVEFEQSDTLDDGTSTSDGYTDYTDVETGNLSSAGTSIRVELSKPVGDELIMEWYDSTDSVASDEFDLDSYFGHPSANDDVESNTPYKDASTWSDGKQDTNGISWYNPNNGGDFSGWFADTRPDFIPYNDGYSWRARGYIYAPESGTYTFGTDGDDGNDVVIDGERLSFSDYSGDTDWTQQSSPEDKYLLKGYHTFEARMQEGSSGDNFKVGWEKPSDFSISTIPSRYFHTTEADTELYLSAWVDWDKDGFLYDENRINLGSVSMQDQVGPDGNFQRINMTGVVVPEDEGRVEYGTTLMRLSLREDRYANYYEDEGTYGGEVEDYTVDVTPNLKEIGSNCLGVG